jgi:hypothetical protein
MTERRRHRDTDRPADPRVAAVLAAAAAPTEPGRVPGEVAALAAFRVAVPRQTRRIRMLPTLKATAVAATATGALLVGGVAAASTGALPGAASDTARAALAKVGVTVDGPADAAAVHTTTRGKSVDARARHDAAVAAKATPTAAASASVDASAHGAAVSELATTTTLTGKDKGVAVSTLASQGRARAHQPTPTATATTAAPATGSTAGAEGRATADERSSGRSTTGQSHRP